MPVNDRVRRRSSRNVKRWQSGEMCLCWTPLACSMPSASSSRVISHASLAKVAHAIEREVSANHKRQTAVLTPHRVRTAVEVPG